MQSEMPIPTGVPRAREINDLGLAPNPADRPIDLQGLSGGPANPRANPGERESPAAAGTANGAPEAVGSANPNLSEGCPASPPEATGDALTFAELDQLPRWVAWRMEDRGGEPAKVPHSPRSGKAQANNPATWGTRSAAEARAKGLGVPGQVGVMLGELDAARALGGVDLDTCRDAETGELEPWAVEVIDALDSYTEVSPSGTGVKVFFLYNPADLPALRAFMGGSEWSKTFPRSNGQAHPPAIECHFGARYFALTGQSSDASPGGLRKVSLATLRRLLREIGPRFRDAAPSSGSATVLPLGDADGDLWDRIRAAAMKRPALRRLLDGDFPRIKDTTRSGLAFALGSQLKAADFEFHEMAEAVRSWPETAEWCREKGDTSGGRGLRRIWENSKPPREKQERRDRDDAPEWFDGLACNRFGEPLPTLANTEHALRAAPEFEGVFLYDLFSARIMVVRRPPWLVDGEPFAPRALQENDAARFRTWCERHGLRTSKENAWDAIALVAEDHAFHPVRDYLAGLTWDGVPRLDSMFTRYFQAPATELNAAFGRRFLISAVARIMKPGCKADHALILEGEQGIGKSTAVKTLCGEQWFTDHLPEIGSKDCGLQLQGRWILELGEMTNVTRAEADRVKQFLTTSTDSFRPPYGRVTADFPRQCVFIGTINPTGRGYLKDETGNRRFWIVECGGKIDLAGLAEARDQLWAEAAARYAAGEEWYLKDEALQEQQAAIAAERRDSDPLLELVSRHVATLEVVPQQEVLELLTTTRSQGERGETVTVRAPTKADQMRLTGIMRDLGWEPERRRVAGGEKQRFYVRTAKAGPPRPPEPAQEEPF